MPDRNPIARQGPSPEALAAFYRHRSESLRNSHTTTEEVNTQMNKQQEVKQADMGFLDYIISALAGHPGVK